MSPKPYKLVSLQQGSPEWLLWRQNKIGASDSPTIMGLNPDKSPYDLYLEMAGIISKEKSTSNMQYGHEMEPIIRDYAEKELGMEFNPICIESNNSCFIASLDGLSWDELIFIECKANNKERHELARKGTIAEAHYIQMQHIFGVLGHNIYRKAYYISYHQGEFIIVEINPSTRVWNEIVEKGKEFYERIQNRIPPDFTDDDHVYRDDETLYQEIVENQIIYAQLKALEKKYQDQKESIIQRCGNRPTRIKNYIVTRGIRKGNIDYTLIPELKGVDLEQYRKASTVTWSIK